jgi:hypothetical protein
MSKKVIISGWNALQLAARELKNITFLILRPRVGQR